MAERIEPFVLHPSVVSTAIQHNHPNSAIANRLLGDVAMGRRVVFAVGGSDLLELHTIAALIASKALDELSIEDLTNVLHDLHHQLHDANLYEQLRAEPIEPYQLAAVSLAVRHRLELDYALMLTVAGVRGVALVLDDEHLYPLMELVAVTHPGLRLVRLIYFV